MREIHLLKKPLFWLISGLILIWIAIFQLPDNQVHLVFCDVGQGEATLISHRSTQILIDGGPNDQVLKCLSENLPFWDRTIEMVVLTHPQADHFTGLIDVIERYDVRQFVINSIVPDAEGIFGGQGFWEFYQAVVDEEAKIYSPQTGDKFRLGPMEFLVLWPGGKLGDERIWLASQGNTSDGDQAEPGLLRGVGHHVGYPTVGGIGEYGDTHLRGVQLALSEVEGATSEVLGSATYSGDLNEISIVLQLSFGNFDALLTGDISFDIEKQISWSAVSQQLEVLKVAHHGSKYSTGEEFLKKIQPQLAVISVGAKNRFGHPTKETIERLSNQAIKLLRTDQEGEVEIVSDGRRWGIRR